MKNCKDKRIADALPQSFVKELFKQKILDEKFERKLKGEIVQLPDFDVERKKLLGTQSNAKIKGV